MLDLEEAQVVAITAAKKAGDRILKGFEEDLRIDTKGDPVDRVTQVDLDCQQTIIEIIHKKFPDHVCIGEETIPNQPATPPLPTAPAKPVWLIDPLDGTSNFIKRLPLCGTSIGLEVNGEVVLGVLHFPVFGWTYTAVKGRGAYRDGKRIHVSACARLQDAMIAECYSDRIHRGKNVMFPPVLAYRKFGSAITSLAFTADGRIDGTGLLCYPWDIAAARVIIPEAGGALSWQYASATGDRDIVRCIASCEGIHAELQSFVKQAV
ncbi:inositol monophosphatase [Candidatus Peregrinibacteria bacterium]|nr:inositol monophosphatase [Candidatus Peregrinibacteria bacterium]